MQGPVTSKKKKWNGRILSIRKVGVSGRIKDRSSGVSLQKQAPEPQSRAGKGRSCFWWLQNHAASLPSVPAEWGPCTPPASAHNPLASMCIWLAELSQMTASQRQRKPRNVGVSHSILGRQIHTMGNHHDTRVSKDLANREEPEEFRFYRAPVLDSWYQSAPGSVSLASR